MHTHILLPKKGSRGDADSVLQGFSTRL